MTDSAHFSEDSIIDLALKGDESAYRHLLEKYKTFAFTIALRIVPNREDAEEVAQDSFVKAFKALRGFNRAGKFSTWLYRIVYRTALTSIRRGRIELEYLEESPDYEHAIPDEYANGFDKLIRQDQEKYIQMAISKLSETDKLVVTLFYTCENTIQEISAITGWNPSTIKVRLHRARQKLHTELSELLSDETTGLL
ncbi:RNA polymerase sigma factor [Persicitalea sp.]|uniref:RNA polymerase sigma factor n=1 Tax=Persicitalea sp. TaxID=3100273 RepID=UPI00359428DE